MRIFRLLGALGILVARVRATPDGSPTTEPDGSSSSATTSPQIPTPSVSWGSMSTWQTCQQGRLIWVYQGPTVTSSGTVNMDIEITNDEIDQTDPDGDGDNDQGDLTSSHPIRNRRGIPGHLSASVPASSQSASPITTVLATSIPANQGVFTWNQVTLPAGFYKVVSTVTADPSAPMVFNSSFFAVQNSSDTSCLTSLPSGSPSLSTLPPLPTGGESGNGSTNTESGSLATSSKINKPAIIGGSIIGGLVLIGGLIAAFVFMRFSNAGRDVSTRSGKVKERWNGLGSYDDSAQGAAGQQPGPGPKKKPSWNALTGLGLGAAASRKNGGDILASSSHPPAHYGSRSQTQSFPTSVTTTASADEQEKYAMNSLGHGEVEKSPFSDSGHNVVGIIPIGYSKADYQSSSQQLTPSEYGAIGRKGNRYSASTSNSQSYTSMNYSRPTSTTKGFAPSPSPQLVPFTPDNLSSDDLARASPIPPTTSQQGTVSTRKMSSRKPVPAYLSTNLSSTPSLSSQALTSSHNHSQSQILSEDSQPDLTPPNFRPQLVHKSSVGSFTGKELGEHPESGKMMYALMPDPPLQR